MASHRKPRTGHPGRFRPGTVASVATGAAVSVTASVTALAAPAQAEPAPATEQIRIQVDAPYLEAEQSPGRYDGAGEQTDVLQRQVGRLQDEPARRTTAFAAARTRLGSLASERYRSSGLSGALQLALTDDPQQFLQRAGMLDQAGAIEQQTLQQYGQQSVAPDTRAAETGSGLTEPAHRQRQLAADRAAVQRKLARAQALLDRLTAGERAVALGGADSTGTGSTRSDAAGSDAAGSDAAGSDAAGSDAAAGPAVGRAAAAIAFARSQLGKPCVRGATGPDSYDCSGLVQAAWQSAGVPLPRTTYAQIGAAPRVPRGELRPGDLVFFYSGVSHVGLYAGHGRMIHAPHPGAPVRFESVDAMPFGGAVRPA
ncbi:C40 family peptidase [Kitasatospora sp. GP82]|uniref:C40 family peptidase n=1 Tax=Kitasatospora sp. GP82 TaxID=3035089 RepID=UPI0024750A51|nr:C40 family peptidase [Kitasatospora sp. GP82]MDH6124216.1 cell wall-associated NlpC family hydrolase [Kitasatospora sp. GP82]